MCEECETVKRKKNRGRKKYWGTQKKLWKRNSADKIQDLTSLPKSAAS